MESRRQTQSGPGILAGAAGLSKGTFSKTPKASSYLLADVLLLHPHCPHRQEFVEGLLNIFLREARIRVRLPRGCRIKGEGFGYRIEGLRFLPELNRNENHGYVLGSP